MSDDEAMSSSSAAASRKRKSGATESSSAAAASSSSSTRVRRTVAAVNYNDNDEGDENDDEDADDPSSHHEKKKRKSSSTGERKQPEKPSLRQERRDDDDEADDAHAQDEDEDEAEMKEAERYFEQDGDNPNKAAAAAASSSSSSGQAEMTLEQARAFQRSGGKKTTDESHAFVATDPECTRPAGILKRMKLKNFMNHRRLDLKFNPCVNFIHGKNGAGKSSILHGIQVVFGGNAADTKRGSSVKQLITEGCDEAEVIVWIKNEESPLAFKYELYGDEIQLSRTLKSSGSSTYKMSGKNADGKSYSTTKTKEIKEMWSHFNILVSNPCVVMTQEVSKKFLQSGDSSSRYDFFVQATQIEGLRQELRTAMINMEQMKVTIKNESQTLPDLEKQIAELQKQEKLAEETELIHRDLKLLADKIIWAEVKELDKRFDELEFEYKGVVEKLEAYRSRRTAMLETMESQDDYERSVAQHTKLCNDHNKQATAYTQEIEGKHQEIIRIKGEQKGVLRMLKQWETQIADLEKKKHAAQEEIKKIEIKNARDTSSANSEREDQKNQVIARKTSLLKEMDALHVELQSISSKDSEIRMNESRVREECNQLQKKINVREGFAHTLESESGAQPSSSSSSSAAASSSPPVIGSPNYRWNVDFGFRSKEIWREIKKTHWTVEPIGPMGEYINFKEEHKGWVSAVSNCMTAKSMQHYIVDNFADQKKLKAIFDSIQISVPVMVLKKGTKRFDVGARPNVTFAMVRDCITIDDAWAFNSIVFLTKFERAALFDKSESAVTELKRLWNGGARDMISAAYLTDGSKVQVKGQSGSTVVERGFAKPMFRISNSERLAATNAEIAALRAEFETAQRSMSQFKSSLAECGNENRKVRSKMDQLKMQIRNLDEELNRLEFESDKARREMVQIDDTPQRDLIVRYVNDIGELEERIAASKRTDEKQFLDRIAQVESQIPDLESKVKLAQEEAANESGWVAQAFTERAKKELKLKKYGEFEKLYATKGAELEVQLMPLSSQREVALAKAQTQRPGEMELTPQETVVKLKSLYEAKFQIYQEKQRREKIDINHVRQQLKATQLKKAETEARLSSVNSNRMQLESMGSSRMSKMKECRKALGNSAGHYFHDILFASGASGQLIFNHTEGTLTMIINPNTSDSERLNTSSTIVLSGGERSVATIAFTMAVGELVESPFRAIDEFDVFMDSINRRRSIDLLLSIAKRRKDRQFFFLSPQDVNGIPIDQFLQVLKLKDPERNQQTLAFSQQQDDQPNQE